jgi:hypothetical protein
VGLTGTINTGLNGRRPSTYTENSTALIKKVTNGRHFLYRCREISYSATFKDQLTFAADADCALEIPDMDLTLYSTAFRLSAGMGPLKIKTMNGNEKAMDGALRKNRICVSMSGSVIFLFHLAQVSVGPNITLWRVELGKKETAGA